jgi:hypothetical protein
LATDHPRTPVTGAVCSRPRSSSSWPAASRFEARAGAPVSSANVMTFARKRYPGASGNIRTPFNVIATVRGCHDGRSRQP